MSANLRRIFIFSATLLMTYAVFGINALAQSDEAPSPSKQSSAGFNSC